MKKRLLSGLSALFLLLWAAACSVPEPDPQWKLYFPAAAFDEGPALGSEALDVESPPSQEELILALLSGPSVDTLYSPFPKGVSLRSWYTQDGILHINLSEQYGGLSGMALTLADYSITLTLCQLPDVEGVSIIVENDPMAFRYHQILTPEDVLLTDLAADEAE